MRRIERPSAAGQRPGGGVPLPLPAMAPGRSPAEASLPTSPGALPAAEPVGGSDATAEALSPGDVAGLVLGVPVAVDGFPLADDGTCVGGAPAPETWDCACPWPVATWILAGCVV